jgi:F-type H+-transporting ATPase subunit delta
MRGVSAETREAVLAVVDRQVSDGADAAELGDDLFAVVGVLDAQPALRRMLTNPSSSSDAKNGLVARLFDGKIGAPAFEALEDAGVEAHLAGAERSGDLESAEDELFRFSRVVHGNPALRAALSDRTMSVARKRELVGALLEKRALSATVSLVKQAVAARRRAFELTLEDYVEVAAARRNQLVATVRAAYDLDLDQRERLATALQGLYGKPVHINVVVEPSLLGGATIEVGGEVIDSSVSGRLEQARRKMAG